MQVLMRRTLSTSRVALLAGLALFAGASLAQPANPTLHMKLSVDGEQECGFSSNEITSYVRDLVAQGGWRLVDDSNAERYWVQVSFTALERPRGSCVVSITASIWRKVQFDKRTIRAATVSNSQFGTFNVGNKSIVSSGIRAAITQTTREAIEERL